LGNHYYQFRSNETPFNNSLSSSIAIDKFRTNKLLESAGIPVPKAIHLTLPEFQQPSWEDKITTLTFPVVIKPVDGSLGIDVLCNIPSFIELKKLLPLYFSHYESIVIEEFYGNLKSYRVLVFRKKIIGVVLRHPASVLGDGIHTIQELIELTNQKRKQSHAVLGPIVIDEECHIRLRELGIGVDYVPKAGEKVVLCYTSNATRGGTFESLGKMIGKENRKLMIRVAETLDLNLVGIDVECVDINVPIKSSKGVIIEVNHKPNIRIHEIPLCGHPTRVTQTIMRSLIYRHPFAYLYSLFTNQPTKLYLRVLILVVMIGVMQFIDYKVGS
jgi:D-alanine-D-alanine ligase-like ATP-grasp enzyme